MVQLLQKEELLLHSNTTLVKVKFHYDCEMVFPLQIQIQHLLKLNLIVININILIHHSNTTLVKVK